MQIPGFQVYGGATYTRVYDGANYEYVACCAQELINGSRVNFGFYIFKRLGDGPWARVPLQRFCTGRGSISNGGKWVAVDQQDFYIDVVPGWVAPPAPVGQPGPKGDTGATGPQGPAGAGLSPRYVQALEKLCTLLGI